MTEQRFYKTKEEIEGWLNKYEITNYTLIPDKQYGFVIDVSCDVDLSNKNLIWIPIKFNIVSNDFYCVDNKLNSLNGCPKEVGGSFYCSNNKLTSLEFCPKEVSDFFGCSNNQLTSLKFCPQIIGGGFDCSNNQLTSLKYAPIKISESFFCNSNKLTSLEFCPQFIEGNFYCNANDIEDLIYFPKKVNTGFVDLKLNKNLDNLQYIQDFNLLFKEHLKQAKEKENNDLFNVIDKNIKSDIINKKIKI